MKKRYLMCLPVLIIILSADKSYSQSVIKSDTVISHNIDIFSSVYKKIVNTYPGPIEPGELMVSGLNHMLQTIDPFTYFFSQSDVEEFKLNMSGKYGGTGMVIRQSAEGFFVKEIFENMPAARSGIQAADMIREIDGINVRDKALDEVLDLLIGAPGSDVAIVITRSDTQKISLRFKREEINMSPIPYYGMLDDNIAYIRLLRESEDCSSLVKAALKELSDKFHFKGLVFDLRSNEGGYFKEAIKIANLFVEKGAVLASIRAKDKDTIYYATEAAIYPAVPLVLLIDNYTSSSGEVLTGAIQDNDRGVVIGQQSYGKGFVQDLFDMPGGTMLKLTTASYYTPSGRCIQAFNYDKGTKTIVADSSKKVFKTVAGRKVYSSGGISPEIYTVHNESPAIVVSLLEQYLIFDFATKYKRSHPSIGKAGAFRLSDKDYSDFISFVRSRKNNYITDTEKNLSAMKEKAIKEGYWPMIQNDYAQLEKKIMLKKENDLRDYKDMIKTELEAEIAYRYAHQKGRFAVNLREDRDVKKAIETLMDPSKYRSLLGFAVVQKQ